MVAVSMDAIIAAARASAARALSNDAQSTQSTSTEPETFGLPKFEVAPTAPTIGTHILTKPGTPTETAPPTIVDPFPRWPRAPRAPVPTPGPVRNLIVEEALQRRDQMITLGFGPGGPLGSDARFIQRFPTNGRDLVREMPAHANPYLEVPIDYRVAESAASHSPVWGNWERPLDLFRYKADQFWNLLVYEGQYDPESLPSDSTGDPGRILPFELVRVDTDLNTLDFEQPEWKQGTIGARFGINTHNPFAVHYKEEIYLVANPFIFGNVQGAHVEPCQRVYNHPGPPGAPPTIKVDWRNWRPAKRPSFEKPGPMSSEKPAGAAGSLEDLWKLKS